MKTCAENHSLCYKICIRLLFSPDVNFAFNGQTTELNSIGLAAVLTSIKVSFQFLTKKAHISLI